MKTKQAVNPNPKLDLPVTGFTTGTTADQSKAAYVPAHPKAQPSATTAYARRCHTSATDHRPRLDPPRRELVQLTRRQLTAL